MKTLRLCFACILAGSLCLAAAASTVEVQQETISEKLIRLHVIANSDAEGDQKVKLQVRDAVLAYMQGEKWDNREQAQTWIGEHLQEISDIASETLVQNRMPMHVSATLCMESYPTRQYDTFSLPAGEYLSLKVVLGEGQGKNWWCVVYPAICAPAAGEDFQTAAASAGFTNGEIAWITEETETVKIRFKLLEWIQKWKT